MRHRAVTRPVRVTPKTRRHGLRSGGSSHSRCPRRPQCWSTRIVMVPSRRRHHSITRSLHLHHMDNVTIGSARAWRRPRMSETIEIIQAEESRSRETLFFGLDVNWRVVANGPADTYDLNLYIYIYYTTFKRQSLHCCYLQYTLNKEILSEALTVREATPEQSQPGQAHKKRHCMCHTRLRMRSPTH